MYNSTNRLGVKNDRPTFGEGRPRHFHLIQAERQPLLMARKSLYLGATGKGSTEAIKNESQVTRSDLFLPAAGPCIVPSSALLRAKAISVFPSYRAAGPVKTESNLLGLAKYNSPHGWPVKGEKQKFFTEPLSFTSRFHGRDRQGRNG